MVRVTVNANDAIAHLLDMENRAANPLPAHEVVAQHLRNAILRNFRRGGWFPVTWRRSTRAQQQGGKTLVDTAILRNSIHGTATASYAAAGTDVVYAAIHNYGGACGRNHATDMPARPFLPIDAAGDLEPELARRIERTIGQWITEGRP